MFVSDEIIKIRIDVADGLSHANPRNWSIVCIIKLRSAPAGDIYTFKE